MQLITSVFVGLVAVLMRAILVVIAAITGPVATVVLTVIAPQAVGLVLHLPQLQNLQDLPRYTIQASKTKIFSADFFLSFVPEPFS